MIFITGGVASGKKTYAKQLAADAGHMLPLMLDAATCLGDEKSVHFRLPSIGSASKTALPMDGRQDEPNKETNCLIVHGWDMAVHTSDTRMSALQWLQESIKWEKSQSDHLLMILSRTCGNEVVPIVRAHRIWRDEYGFFCQSAANLSDTAYRLWSGLPECLKQQEGDKS